MACLANGGSVMEFVALMHTPMDVTLVDLGHCRHIGHLARGMSRT